MLGAPWRRQPATSNGVRVRRGRGCGRPQYRLGGQRCSHAADSRTYAGPRFGAADLGRLDRAAVLAVQGVAELIDRAVAAYRRDVVDGKHVLAGVGDDRDLAAGAETARVLTAPPMPRMPW